MPLYVLATPLGNLSDISLRARDMLAQADLVAAEDTRKTRKLLSALEIPAPPMVSYRGHEEARRAQSLLQPLQEGKRVVLVSDAGTPALSDPGMELVRLCHENGIPIASVPGASAAVCALSVSGLPAIPSHILGFPPRKPGPMRRWLVAKGGLPGTLVLYESPRRTVALAQAVAEVLGDRQTCLCRELTKLHEEILSLPAADMALELAGREKLRGEVVFVVGPGEPPTRPEIRGGEGDLRGIAAALAERWGVPRREAYQQLLELERDRIGPIQR